MSSLSRSSFTNFVGIDQTGAYDYRKSKYLPLKICHWDQKNHFLRLGEIPSFTPRALLEFGIPLSERTLILVDTVFGLPRELNRESKEPWDWFKHASEFREYGRKGAEKYFNQKLIPYTETLGQAIPVRKVELQVRANSLFKSKPYQKNIQTGSFRIWQDLGSASTHWISLWPFEAPAKGRSVLTEGYPSFLWREVFGMKSRQANAFKSKVTKLIKLSAKLRRQLDVLKSNPDLCDAAVLALGASIFLDQNPKYLNASALIIHSQEGWIFGARF
ncbi:MAG: hypothetical protein KA715_08815 [Xanthomonadaceae bacterium]|nr:hypothetical protein [Xanthomonadaceae bacterium]